VRAPSPLAPENAKFLNFKRGEVRAPEHKNIFKKKRKKKFKFKFKKERERKYEKNSKKRKKY